MELVDEDGLPMSEVGEWTLDKHERLRKYVDAAHGARRKFAGRTTYIDLYCGPGRSRIRETQKVVDGSPLIAWEAAGLSKDQFSEFLLADTKSEFLEAARKRLADRGAKVRTFPGEAHAVVDQVLAALDPKGLHLALLDPYNLGALPFELIKKLFAAKRMDVIVHVSAGDLARNLPLYMRSDGAGQLDRFAPGWREHVDLRRSPELVRHAIFEYWRTLIKGLGATANDCVEVVENSKHADLYWLVFVARHKLAHKLWAAIANVTLQTRLFN